MAKPGKHAPKVELVPIAELFLHPRHPVPNDPPKRKRWWRR